MGKSRKFVKYVRFAPENVSTYPPGCGISRVHVSMNSPKMFVSERREDLLKAKFDKLRSDYGVAYSNFQKSGQHDNSAFPAFSNGFSWLINTFIFVFKYLHLLHDVTRAFPTSAQREEESVFLGQRMMTRHHGKVEGVVCLIKMNEICWIRRINWGTTTSS